MLLDEIPPLNLLTPSRYLQTFPPQHKSICANNCTYVGGIGTVGNFHIGVYTRILLMFLLDPLTRPSTYWMEFWVDMTRWLKARAPTGAFDFFTYSELLWWFFFVSQPESSTQKTLANLISVSPSTPSDGSGPSLCLQAWALDCHWKLWTRRRRSEMALESQLITRRIRTD